MWERFDKKIMQLVLAVSLSVLISRDVDVSPPLFFFCLNSYWKTRNRDTQLRARTHWNPRTPLICSFLRSLMQTHRQPWARHLCTDRWLDKREMCLIVGWKHFLCPRGLINSPVTPLLILSHEHTRLSWGLCCCQTDLLRSDTHVHLLCCLWTKRCLQDMRHAV